jgi:PAS domain S-box-containing protein
LDNPENSIYRSAFENCPDGILICNKNLFVEAANPVICNILQYSFAELYKSDFRKIIDSNDAKLKRLLTKGAKIGHNSDIITLLRKDGSSVSTEISLKTFQDNLGMEWTVIIVRDVSCVMLAGEVRRESEVTLKSLIESSRCSIWSVDKELKLIYGNNIHLTRHEMFTGHKLKPGEDALAGLSGLFKDVWEQFYRRALTGESFSAESYLPPPAQKTFLRYSFNPMKTSKGKIIGLTVMSQDLSEQKNTEVKLRNTSQRLKKILLDQDKIREKERTSIARDLHDDLGQKLTAMNLDLAWIRKLLNPEQKELMDRISSLSILLSGMIENVRDIASDMNPAILRSFGLSRALKLQLETASRNSGIKYQLNFEGKVPGMDFKYNLVLFRVFQESLTNILKHSDASFVIVTVKKGRKNVIMNIIDNGKGISQRNLKNPMSPGLTGMRERVDSVGGKISISGKQNTGTFVKVRLPISI